MKNIILTGFMGTGKTAVSRKLADMLQWPLADTDDLIEASARKTISEIFSQQGELAFRALESKVLQDLAQQTVGPLVVATGGGIVLAEANWPWLRHMGHVVCLYASPEEIVRRVGGNGTRPLLQGSGKEVLSRVRTLLEKRQAAYAKADWTCNTEGLTPDEVADRIVRRFAADT